MHNFKSKEGPAAAKADLAPAGMSTAPATTTLQVIGAGFGRTGTMSLKAALETLLGGRCYHMIDVIQGNQTALWARVFKDGWSAHSQEVEAALAGCTAAVDLPVHMFYRELLAAHPNVKVVLTVRNFDTWYESVLSTIWQVHQLMVGMPLHVRLVLPKWKHHRTLTSAYFGPAGLFQGRFPDKDFVRLVWEGYVAGVKASVPHDRLLVFDVREGWGPLCEFLGCPVPHEPFPRVNDTCMFQERVRGLKRYLRTVSYGAPLLLAALAVGLRLVAGTVVSQWRGRA